METRPTVRVYDGDDIEQTQLSQAIGAKQEEFDALGKYNPKRIVLKRQINKLRLELDKRAIELGRKSRFISGSHG